MSALVLGLDVGTQGAKALLVDVERGEVVGRGAAGYGLIAGLPEGAAEQHPETWIDGVRAASRAALADASRRAGGADPAARVTALGVSGQQHGLVVLDRERRVLRAAKLWCDTTTAAEAVELTQLLERRVPAGYTAPKLLWLRRHEPAIWERTRHVLLPHDYVNFRLTGALTSEAGDASGTGWFDPVTRRCDADELDAIDPRLAELLAPLIDSDAPAGRLHAEGAALLGLPEGLLVAIGSGDNMCSAIGSGATRPGVVVASLGTSCTVFSRAESPVVDARGLIAPFCDAAGGWLPLLCVMNGTNVLEQVRRDLQACGRAATLDELTAAAAAEPPGCEGLLCVPYLHGERVPDLPNARGLLHGLSPTPLGPGRLFRAALEGLCLNLAWGVDRLRGLGIAVQGVRVVGGGARNALWRQLLADTLDAPVQQLAESESAALGAALQAAWCARRQAGEELALDALARPAVRLRPEVSLPDPARVALHREQGQRFRALVGASFGWVD